MEAKYLEVLKQTSHGVTVSWAGDCGLSLEGLEVLVSLEEVLLLRLTWRKHLAAVQQRLQVTQLVVIQRAAY